MARTTGRPGTRGPGRTRRGRPAAVTTLLLGALLTAGGCATGTEPSEETSTATASPSPTTSASPTASGDATAAAVDGAWVLTEGEVDGAELTLVDGAPVTLLVDGDTVSGSAACNTYTAGVDASAGWRVGDAAVTRIACEEQLMTLESAYLDALARVDSAQVTDDTLELTGTGVRLLFSPDPDAQ